MNDDALARADARVHRCHGCGSWLYAERPCTTCDEPESNEVAA